MPGNPHATDKEIADARSKLFMPDVWKELAAARAKSEAAPAAPACEPPTVKTRVGTRRTTTARRDQPVCCRAERAHCSGAGADDPLDEFLADDLYGRRAEWPCGNRDGADAPGIAGILRVGVRYRDK